MRPARPLVIAHRGSSGHRPENTRPAFELAIEHRADMIETDLHITTDGEIVLSHDAELDHLGREGELVGDLSAAEVRALDAGDGEPVPTLEETLDLFGARIPWNLEFKKPPQGYYEGIEVRTLAAVESRGLLDQTLFSSFFDPVLVRLRDLSPGARIALLLSPRFPDRAIERARAVGAEAINPMAEMTTPALVDEAHAAGLAVYVFTVDDPEAMKRLLDWGVDGLFTNLPDRMRRLVPVEGG